MKKLVILSSFAVALGLVILTGQGTRDTAGVLFACDKGAMGTVEASGEVENINLVFTETKLQVDGITCFGCVRTIKRALNKIDGVEKVDVNIKKGLVTIRCAKSCDAEVLAQSVTEAGYPAKIFVDQEETTPNGVKVEEAGS